MALKGGYRRRPRTFRGSGYGGRGGDYGPRGGGGFGYGGRGTRRGGPPHLTVCCFTHSRRLIDYYRLYRISKEMTTTVVCDRFAGAVAAVCVQCIAAEVRSAAADIVADACPAAV